MRAIFLLLFITTFVSLASSSQLHGRISATTFEDESFLPFLSDTILDLADTVRYELDDCAMVAEVCIGTPLDDISNYQITTNGAAYTNGIGGCDFDTTNIYSYTNLFGQGSVGDYILQSWNINGSTFSSPFSSIDQLVDSMNVWDPTGNWINDVSNQLISGGTPGNEYSDMIVFVLTISSVNVIGLNESFIPQGTMLFMNSGVTELIVTESLTGASDTAVIIASCVQPDTVPNFEIVFGETESYCMDLSELPGNFVNSTSVCSEDRFDLLFTNSNTCVDLTGTAVGMDTACIVTCDDLGYCDTTTLFLNILPVTGTHVINDTIFAGATDQWCVDQFVFQGTPDTIYNICPENGGAFTNYVLDEVNLCVNYTGLMAGGSDQGCFVVCDELDNCDTTFLNVTVKRLGPAIFQDTVFINQSGTFCDWDDTNLFGAVTGIQNDCPTSSGIEVFFDLDETNFCIEYDAMMLGKDTACIILTDATGNVDTTTAIVCVVLPETETITDNIRLTNTAMYCVDTTQLGGTIISIANICEDLSGEDVLFTIDTSSLCLDIAPIQLGTDTACIVICDDFGICDTTTYIVNVTEDDLLGPPVTIDDNDSTDINTSIVIDACFNDSLPSGLELTNFFVLPVSSGGVGPLNGTAFSNADCTVSYVPLDDFCGADQITYVACNPMGCDTATISINVLCPSSEFQIFNAFSPNGDGVNDSFRINGLEQFPNHTVKVFNRWGNEVLSVSNYQNNWEAQWEGLDLPDGTYFYLFDTGAGETRTGYVYIGR